MNNRHTHMLNKYINKRTEQILTRTHWEKPLKTTTPVHEYRCARTKPYTNNARTHLSLLYSNLHPAFFSLFLFLFFYFSLLLQPFFRAKRDVTAKNAGKVTSLSDATPYWIMEGHFLLSFVCISFFFFFLYKVCVYVLIGLKYTHTHI